MTTTPPDTATWTRGGGPLTTVFTTPDFCDTLDWRDTITPPLLSSICMPPRFKEVNDYSWGYYSPGICPSQYIEGCSFPTSLATTGPNNGWVSYGGPVLASETVRICCPNGYVCVTEGIQQAYSKCAATTDSEELAYAIQVRWQATDLPILETDPTVAGKTYEAPATSGALPTVAATPTETGASSAATITSAGGSTAEAASSGLTKSTSISIGVGVAAAALVVISVISFCLWSRKRKRRAENGTRLQSPPIVKKSEQSSGVSGVSGGGAVMELDSKALASTAAFSSELDSNSVVEMPSEPTTFYAELPGSIPQGYYEKEADTSWRSKTSGDASRKEYGPFTLAPARQSGLRASSNLLQSPSATSPSSNLLQSPSVASPQSWTSSVHGSVSDLTDQTNGRTM